MSLPGSGGKGRASRQGSDNDRPAKVRRVKHGFREVIEWLKGGASQEWMAVRWFLSRCVSVFVSIPGDGRPNLGRLSVHAAVDLAIPLWWQIAQQVVGGTPKQQAPFRLWKNKKGAEIYDRTMPS